MTPITDTEGRVLGMFLGGAVPDRNGQGLYATVRHVAGATPEDSAAIVTPLAVMRVPMYASRRQLIASPRFLIATDPPPAAEWQGGQLVRIDHAWSERQWMRQE